MNFSGKITGISEIDLNRTVIFTNKAVYIVNKKGTKKIKKKKKPKYPNQ